MAAEEAQSAPEKLGYAVDHFGDRQIVTIRKGHVQVFMAGLSSRWRRAPCGSCDTGIDGGHAPAL